MQQCAFGELSEQYRKPRQVEAISEKPLVVGLTSGEGEGEKVDSEEVATAEEGEDYHIKGSRAGYRRAKVSTNCKPRAIAA